VLDDRALVVEVVERPEAVLVVSPRTPGEWGLFGYYIGNSHQPVMVTERAIVCPDVPGMDLILEQHGIMFSRDVRPFTPVQMTELPGHVHGDRQGLEAGERRCEV
jgi:urease accessory protein UreE